MNERQTWDNVTSLLGNQKVEFGHHWSYNFRNDPKRLGFVLSRYKFAAKMTRARNTICELGCSEGLGAPILAEGKQAFYGIDLDKGAIASAKQNLSDSKYTFVYDDFMGKKYGNFEAIVSMDVIEHIQPEHENLYFQTVLQNLSLNGICVIGTPNITSAPYASEASQIGHINLYSQQRLKNKLHEYFHTVFAFGMNDEVVHTGYHAMSHFIICIAFDQK